MLLTETGQAAGAAGVLGEHQDSALDRLRWRALRHPGGNGEQRWVHEAGISSARRPRQKAGIPAASAYGLY